MTQQSTHIDDLIVRFFTEDLTADEQLELSRWKAASPDNRAYFARLEDIWLSVSVAEGNRKYHKDEAYAGFLKRKAAAETRRPMSGRGRWSRLKYAAVGLLAVGLFSYLSYNSGKQGVMSAFADITVEAPMGSTTKMSLPDGTRVWLNAGSVVSYSQGFGVDNRDVTLTGEGYFEVQKNEQLPFIVSSSTISVRVLGTKFNFRDYASDEQAVVDLAEGSVQLHVADESADRNYRLRPNQRGVFSKASKSMSIENCMAVNARQWTDGELMLNGKSMKEIAAELSRCYNVAVDIRNPKVEDLHFYGTFARREQNLTDVLDALAATGNISYKRLSDRLVAIY